MATDIRVLHVDDEPGVADTAAAFLERQDDRFEIHTATDADRGLEELSSGAFDCVVSDYDMPGTNGIEFLGAVRERHPNLPFILFTGKGSEEIASEAISAGVTDYLQKGGTEQFELLGNRIENAIYKRRAEANYQELFEKTPVGLTIHDPETGVILDSNAGFRQMLGYSQDELAGMHPGALSPAGSEFTKEKAHQLIRDAIETGATRFEWQDETQAGAVIWVDVTLRRTTIDGQERILAAIQDIDDRKEREAALERFETMVEASGDPMYTLDADGHFTYVNDAMSALTTYEQDELIGEYVSLVMDPDDIATGGELIQRLLETDQTRGTFEMDLITDDGDRIECENHIALLPFDEKFRGTVGILRDLTGRIEREQELARQRERFAALFENFPEPTIAYEFVADDPIIRDVNDAFETGFGWDADTAVGTSIDDLIVPEGKRDEAKTVNQQINAGDRVDETLRRRTADGEGVFRFRNIRIPGEEPPDGYAVYMDVTARRAWERRLRILHDVAIRLDRTADPQDVYEILVEVAEEVFEYDLAIADAAEGDVLIPQAVSSNLSSDSYYGETPIDAVDNLAAEAYRTGDSSLFDDIAQLAIKPADPEFRSVLTVPIGDYGIFQAVSREAGIFDEDDRELAEVLCRHARRELRRLEHEAELDRQMDRLEKFASIVSHDLRNPLNVIQGRLELARETAAEDHLDAIGEATNRMEAIIEDTFALAKQGKTVAETETVCIAELATDCWDLVQAPEATLAIDSAMQLKADGERLKQVFENLFQNAIDHAGPDVTVRVGVLDDGGVFVADDGPGIPDDDRAAVFDPSYSTTEDGTGFGLAIVKEIVDAHGWAIEVGESEHGGARFDITGIDIVD